MKRRAPILAALAAGLSLGGVGTVAAYTPKGSKEVALKVSTASTSTEGLTQREEDTMFLPPKSHTVSGVKPPWFNGTVQGRFTSVETDRDGAILSIGIRNRAGQEFVRGCGAKLVDLPHLQMATRFEVTDEFVSMATLVVGVKEGCLDSLRVLHTNYERNTK